MAKDQISEYDSTAANNTVVGDVNIAEGCPPSGINNALREIMSHLKDMDSGTSAVTSPQITSINLGHASDTTIARSSAGVVTIEGVEVVTTTASQTLTNKTFGSLTVDNITIDGTEIDLSSGDLTLDVAGDIILDAGGDEIIFKDGSTNVGHVSMDSDNFTLKSLVSDKDFIIQGNDGGSGITALTLDMSNAGAATFNNNITAYSDARLKSNIFTIPNALQKVKTMRGVHFFREDTQREGTGVIAQEMQNVAPEIVLEAQDKIKTLSVDYGNLTGYLIEAIKELSLRVSQLERQ
tara:strand:+ start:6942 stop:7823 length:882 start_codon:yes stop_codon:yes gene_type:complete